MSEFVERDFQVHNAVVFGRWQVSRAHIYLNGRQQQRRHSKPGITLVTHLDKRRFIDAVVYMNIVFALVADRGPAL